MLLKGLIGLLLLMLLSGVTVSAAQPTVPPLRDLADKNHLYIGAAVYTYHLDDPVYAATLAREFNLLTPENEAKFCELQAQRGVFDFTKLDRLVDFAQQNHMTVRGHNLVWHQCLPDWVANGHFSRDEAIQILHDHIFTVLGRYKGRIPMWDVVNEAIADDGSGLRDTPWRRMIGDDYIELAFRFAHEADPDALLFYNDYSAEGLNTKSDEVYALVQDFVQRGVPINGVGLQSHFIVGTINPAAMAQNMKRLADLGLQVQITELDDRFPGAPTAAIAQQQANDYRQVIDTCLNASNCTAFITWGVGDKFSWLRGDHLGFFNNPAVTPLLFDDQYQPKPAYFAVANALAQHAGESPIPTPAA